jgi:hypothetical protein
MKISARFNRNAGHAVIVAADSWRASTDIAAILGRTSRVAYRACSPSNRSPVIIASVRRRA